MTIPQFKKWLESKRKELASLEYYEENPIFQKCSAARIAIEASQHAAELHLHELMREWDEQAAVSEVDRYLVECLAGIPQTKKDVYNLDEAGDRLGVSRRTVSRLIEAGELECTRVRGRFTITEEQIQAYLAGAESETLF